MIALKITCSSTLF